MNMILPGGGAFGRSARHEVRNPVLALPAARKILDVDPDARRLLGTLLRELSQDAADKAENSWKSHKGIMAAYWKAVSIYAKHLARVIDARPGSKTHAYLVSLGEAQKG